MKEFSRTIDWVRVNSEHTPAYEFFGWKGHKRNFGNGSLWYYDFSPNQKDNRGFFPALHSVPLENFNRVDWAVDYTFNTKEMASYVSFCQKLIGRAPTEIVASKTGKTLYWKGSRDLKIRMYQKGLKERSDNEKWVRLEFEVRSKKVRQILANYGYNAFDYLLGAYTEIGEKVKKIPEIRDSEGLKEERFRNIRSELIKKGWVEDFLVFLNKSVDNKSNSLYNNNIR